MNAELLAAVRDRLSLVTVVAWGVLVAAVYAVTGQLVLPLAFTTAFVISEGRAVVQAAPGVDVRAFDTAVGVCVTGLSAVWLWVEATPTVTGRILLPVLGLAGGLWLLFDVRADRTQEHGSPASVDLDTDELMLVFQHVRLIARELEDEPQTVAELATACDLTTSRVREAIEYGTQSGTFYPVDPDAETPRYAVDERRTGVVGFGRQAVETLSWVGRRFARPFVRQF
jgi:hypothetical protein